MDLVGAYTPRTVLCVSKMSEWLQVTAIVGKGLHLTWIMSTCVHVLGSDRSFALSSGRWWHRMVSAAEEAATAGANWQGVAT